jgi:hypothetical protein
MDSSYISQRQHGEPHSGGSNMRRNRILWLAAIITLLFPGPGFSSASAQNNMLAGSWTLVSSDAIKPDGSRTPTLGANPSGRLVFTSDGQFIWLFLDNALPKFASNNRAAGTPEENAAIARGSIAVFGTYSVEGKDLVLQIERSTFPNWTGTQQRRTVTTLTEAELAWTNPVGSTGGVAELRFKRN